MVIQHISSVIQCTKFIRGGGKVLFLSTIFTDEETEINDFEEPIQQSPGDKGWSKN